MFSAGDIVKVTLISKAQSDSSHDCPDMNQGVR
jgi:hypothetical protein